MTHNLHQERAKLMLSKMYSARPGFLQAVCWQPDSSGHVLVDESTGGNALVAVVGRVLGWQLDCTPRGDYVNQRRGSLQTAKFQLRLMKPDKTPFAADFDAAVEGLAEIQAQTASAQDHRDFILGDRPWEAPKEGRTRYLRFARNVFEKRRRKIKEAPACMEDSSEAKESIDAETENWPVPPALRGELDSLKHEFRAVPLCVYANRSFVKPARVNDVLIDNPLVVVRFKLRHFFVREKNYDSFSASIEQVSVIQPGVPPPVSRYRQGNPRDGPILSNRALRKAHTVSQPVAGPSHFVGAMDSTESVATESAGCVSTEQDPVTSEGTSVDVPHLVSMSDEEQAIMEEVTMVNDEGQEDGRVKHWDGGDVVPQSMKGKKRAREVTM